MIPLFKNDLIELGFKHSICYDNHGKEIVNEDFLTLCMDNSAVTIVFEIDEFKHGVTIGELLNKIDIACSEAITEAIWETQMGEDI